MNNCDNCGNAGRTTKDRDWLGICTFWHNSESMDYMNVAKIHVCEKWVEDKK